MIMEDRLNKNYGCLITILRAPDNFLAQSNNSNAEKYIIRVFYTHLYEIDC